MKCYHRLMFVTFVCLLDKIICKCKAYLPTGNYKENSKTDVHFIPERMESFNYSVALKSLRHFKLITDRLEVSLVSRHPHSFVLSFRWPLSVWEDTWESCGLFQLTWTKPLEFDPDDVDEVLLVTAITCGFPFRPAAVRWSPYLCPIIGVYTIK